MTEVLLFQPSFDVSSQFAEIAELYVKARPMGIVYLATYLYHKGVAVETFDGTVQNLDKDRVLELLASRKPRLVGITCLTPFAPSAHTMAKWIKEFDPRISVVMGGVHPTVLPEETLGDNNVDVVVRREGEITLLELLEAIRADNSLRGLPGISYRYRGTFIHNPDRPFIKDLDSIPIPDERFLPYSLYGAGIGILTSLGCPFNCIFCSARASWGQRYRTRSPENVLKEIAMLVDKYNPTHIDFLDENFTANRKRAHEICDLLIERGYPRQFDWAISARTDSMDLDILKKMKAAGCSSISFGIETYNQRLLDVLNKKTTPRINEQAVRLAKEAGIKDVRATFILGIPTETREDTLNMMRYARKLPLDSAKFSIATPYPGTELFRIAFGENSKEKFDWSGFNPGLGFSRTYDPVWVPEGRTAEELKTLQVRAFLNFYLHPRRIFHLKMFRDIVWKKVGSFKDIKMYWKIFWGILTRVCHRGTRK